MQGDIVKFENISKVYKTTGGFFAGRKKSVYALNDVNLNIKSNSTLGVVGESGCGKTTLGMVLLKLIKPDSGRIFFEGVDITDLSRSQFKGYRHDIQIVFQNPYASLNPRMRIRDIIEEPMIVHNLYAKKERKDRLAELLSLVGLSEDALTKYPHEFSGGQRQRIGIARSLSVNPKFIVADEPVSALDVSIRGGILNLFVKLQKELGLTYLFISHDLKVVEYMCDRIAVMYLGRIVEEFDAENLMKVQHPYTQALVTAIPVPDPKIKKKRIVAKGDLPSPIDPPKGCPYHPRCNFAQGICSVEMPQLVDEYGNGHRIACHYKDKVPRLDSI